MKLLVSCIPYDGGKSGISVYVREVVRALAAQGHELTLLCEPEEDGRETLDERQEELSRLASHVSCPMILAPRWTRRPALSMLWHLFVLPFLIRRHRGEFDGFVICAANRRVCAWYPLPTTATVHDLANFHIPGKYSRSRMFYLAHVLPHFAKKSQHLVAVSGATKADMVKYWGCREEDVTVLYNGLRTSDLGLRWCGRILNDGAETSLAVSGSLKSEVRSLLYISRIEHPGKNHVRLIEAYGKLPRALAEAHPLVIVGSDWKDAEVVHAAAAASPHSDSIRFTGFADGEALERLWGEAGFYVFPSLFEGFGLSLIEAMAMGVPCACSNNGSLGEIAGDVAITFDPYDVESISAALKKLLEESSEERADRVARGLEWAKRFSWEDHAKGLAELLEGHEMRDARRDERSCLSSRVSRPVSTSLFHIPVAQVTEHEAVERIIAFAKSRHSTTIPLNHHTTKPFFVATLNVDFVTNAVGGWPFSGNDELWGYLKNADLVTADGMPIVLLSKLLRKPLPERVTGADMVPAICRRCAEEGLTVYVLGGDRSVVEEAFPKILGHETRDVGRNEVSRLESNVSCQNGPRLLAGVDDSFVKLDEDQPEIISRINAVKPDVLFVALGNPKQELWMGRNAEKLDVGVMIGIGGTFNFIAGRVKRAPRWVQRCGLEWIYRIIQEPRRLWRRYAYGLVKYSWLSLRAVLFSSYSVWAFVVLIME